MIVAQRSSCHLCSCVWCSCSLRVYVSFFEIYGGRCYDLLNKRKKLKILEDGDNRVIFCGYLIIFVDQGCQSYKKGSL